MFSYRSFSHAFTRLAIRMLHAGVLCEEVICAVNE